MMIMFFAPAPAAFHAATVPSVALESAMACRVFRQIRIGLLTDVNTYHDLNSVRVLNQSHLLTVRLPTNGLQIDRTSRGATDIATTKTIKCLDCRDPSDGSSTSDKAAGNVV